MQIVDLFIDSLKSAHTKTKYAYHWERFEQYLPGARKLKAPDKLTESIISYLMQMKKEGLSHSYRAVAFASIKHFYEMADILLNWKKISKFLGENQDRDSSEGYSTEDIRKLLSFADLKYRAVILLYASTGMRREALTQLKVSDFEYLEQYRLYRIRIYKNSKASQICFTTPEAAEVIQLYIRTKGLVKTDKFHDVEPKAVSTLLRTLAVKAGIVTHHSLIKNEEKGRFRSDIPAVHGLRKWCITQLGKSRIDTEIAKLLTGHSIGVRGRYLNYSDDDLLAEFSKAIPFLTIGKENILTNELKDLAIKNEGFVSSVDSRLRQKDEEINKLTKQLELMQQSQKNLSKEIQDKIFGELRKSYTDENGKMGQIIKENIVMKEIIQDHSSKEEMKRIEKFIHGTAKNIVKKTK